MNRILYDADELEVGRLELVDRRATHVIKILRSKIGDSLRLGCVNGPLATGLVQVVEPGRVVLDVEEGDRPPKPTLDLLLAVPRPKVLKRLLPQIASLGVRSIVLCNAHRVERPYFDSHFLREKSELNALLREGLEQAGCTWLPEVRQVRQFKIYIEDELSIRSSNQRRWVLHPYGSDKMVSKELGKNQELVLAVGPEGGWLPYEMELLEGCGFERVGLATRVLRSDTATIAAISTASQMMEAV